MSGSPKATAAAASRHSAKASSRHSAKGSSGHSAKASSGHSAKAAAATPIPPPPSHHPVLKRASVEAAGGAGRPPSPVAPASPNVIGAGGYGTVFAPAFENTNFTNAHTRKKWVTKIYKRKDKYEKAVANISLVQELGFNYNAHPYKRSLSVHTNVPSKSRKTIRASAGSNTIYGIRIPNKGVSIEDLLTKGRFTQLRAIPIPIIISEICKMLGQLHTMSTRHFIHGDVRTTNIVVDPATGIFTIIDFDWFYPKARFLSVYSPSFGFYNNPPESLLFHPSKKASYTHYFQNFMLDVAQLDSIDSITVDNRRFLNRMPTADKWEKMLSTFDSFGLAWSLIRLLESVYPGIIDDDVDKLIETLGPIVTKHGTAYGKDELDMCSLAINSIVQDVLFPLGDFYVERRRTVGEMISVAEDVRDGLGRILEEGSPL